MELLCDDVCCPFDVECERKVQRESEKKHRCIIVITLIATKRGFCSFLFFLFIFFFFSIVHRTCFLSPVCDTQADTSRRKMTDRIKENERDRERSYEDEEKYSIYNLYYLIRV